MKYLVWFVPGLLLAASCVSAGDPDLQPRHVRWQQYPPEVRGVTFDSGGCPWFILAAEATPDQLKRQVEAAVGSPTPAVRGADVALVDSHRRIWLIPRPDLLLGFDPRSHQWLERDALSGQEKGAENDQHPHDFSGPVFESRSGCVYAGDHFGVHVFDGARWSYQPLYGKNVERGEYAGSDHAFNTPCFAEDEQGAVYVWSPWMWRGPTGTIGYWVHDGHAWRQMLVDNNPPVHLADLLPLTSGRLLLCPTTGNAYIAYAPTPDHSAETIDVTQEITRLGSPLPRERNAAHLRLSQLGPRAVPALRGALKEKKDPEVRIRLQRLIEELEPSEPRRTYSTIDGYVFTYARACTGPGGRTATGRDGSYNVWADTVTTPQGASVKRAIWRISPEGRVTSLPNDLSGSLPHSTLAGASGRVYFASPGKGCIALKDNKVSRVTTDAQSAFGTVLGEDAKGRVYLTDGKTVAAFDPSVP